MKYHRYYNQKKKIAIDKVEQQSSSPSACDKLLTHMSTSRFRYLNEQFYCLTSKEAQKLFQQDRQSFFAYHSGYDQSMQKWPDNPLDDIIRFIQKRSTKLIIADFGCGSARLAENVKNKVHSFDLIALNDRVVECDMCHTPLNDESVDIAVFCLSLMGTNMNEYLFEAFRILKLRGIMKIVEIASRFTLENGCQKFIRKIESIGFQCLRTNSIATADDDDDGIESAKTKKKQQQKNMPTKKIFLYI